MAEDLLLLLECHICSELFDDAERKPKVLPCQHTFCLACLRKLAKTKLNSVRTDFFHMNLVTVKCPECSQEFNAPDGGVANFINNLTMIELLRVVPTATAESNNSSDLQKCLEDRLQRLQAKLSEVAEARAKEVSLWEKEVSDTKSSVQKSFAEFHRALREKEAAYITQLEGFSQTRDALVHKTMKQGFEVQLQEIIEFCSKAEEMINGKSCKVSERLISEHLNKCLEITEQLDGARVNETNDEKWRVKFEAWQKDRLKASIEMFGRLQLQWPEAVREEISVEFCRPTSVRTVYTRDYLLAFQTRCLERPANLTHIPGVTLDQPEIQQITEPLSSCTHRPLAARAAIRSAGFRPNHHSWVAKRTGESVAAGDSSHVILMHGSNWLQSIQEQLHHLLAHLEPDNQDVCNLIQMYTNNNQRKSKEFIRMISTEILGNPGGPTAMHAALLGMSYSIPGYQVILRDRVAVLRRYIQESDDTDLELEVLYAAQAFNLNVSNPPGLLRKIFDVLSDEDVIEEETFFDWLNCSDPHEQAGKDVAVKRTEMFFTFLMDYQDPDQESVPTSTSNRRNQNRFAYFRMVGELPSVQEN